MSRDPRAYLWVTIQNALPALASTVQDLLTEMGED